MHPPSTTAPTTTDTATPMDFDSNFQREQQNGKKFRRGGNYDNGSNKNNNNNGSRKSSMGTVMAVVNLATSKQIKDNKNKRNNNEQQVTHQASVSVVRGSSKEGIDNNSTGNSIDTTDDHDTFESRIFQYLSQNSQQPEAIPTKQSLQIDDKNQNSLRFTVNAKLDDVIVSELIDTGSEVSTTDEATVQQSQLSAAPASNMFIQYGNKSKALSTKQLFVTLWNR
ncbi:hypothetical protein BDB00DRAFT_868835 [Zychaea mexicana]|uniref:uncharacterized protein n=1 Tax=Zychaea mexicana TaxID=64656 RepID=UPI0022FEEE3F|nr:uncharacterized protein BDB00DRAFT_868835 [Zychaea mexicana]KAI9496996.1 hypothetical protein BDB00DRAFT_868835 [Zychaea mexicana]